MLKWLVISLFAVNTIAQRDFGVLKFDCGKGEAACNNACYYINCHAHAHGIPNANKVIYESSNHQMTNRLESGCRARIPQIPHDSTTSVCQSFPYSQKFIPFNKQTQTDNWQCDEWPPASSRQEKFGSAGRIANSLRCMPGPENESLGGQLSGFYQGKGNPLGRTQTGPMSPGDHFRVEFDISKVSNKNNVKYCDNTKGPVNCDNDGYQFGLTKKPLTGGKISAPIEPRGNDNHYALQGGGHGDLYQCSVRFTRHGDDDFKHITLANWQNSDHKVQDFKITKPNKSHKLKGLPKDLEIKIVGNIGSKIEFEYAPGEKTSPNWFAWDTESVGTGKGPATGSSTQPKTGSSRAYCAVVKKTAKKDDKKDNKKDGKKKTKRTSKKAKGPSSHGSLPIRPAPGGSTGHNNGTPAGGQKGTASQKGSGSQQGSGGHSGGSSGGNTGGHTGVGTGGSGNKDDNDEKLEEIECYFPCYEHANGR
ncbi:hypothetical protein F4814DRAFT_455766 [Daldinia grandis]|nr:hypothetical protein F4814DRAFT_455766 [Daldinia grandis]